MKTATLSDKPKTAAPKREPLEFVKDGNVLSAYYREIRKTRTLSLAEEKVLAGRIKAGDKEAFNALIEANLKFVVAVCRNYRNQGLPMGDLINEGNLGLIRAAQRFDASLDNKFISYAVWWIREAILTALAEQTRTLTISTGRVVSIQEVDGATHALEQELGRKPVIEEIAEKIGKSIGHVANCLNSKAHSISIHQPDSEYGDSTLESQLQDQDSPDTDKNAVLFLLGESLKDALADLDEKESAVLKMYFGLVDGHEYSLLEIAESLDLSRERIRQIKEKALKKLRHPTRRRRLNAFLG